MPAKQKPLTTQSLTFGGLRNCAIATPTGQSVLSVKPRAFHPLRQCANMPIDFTAVDVTDLLAKAQGHVVRVGQTEVRLDTAGLAVQEFEPDWRTRLLSVITDPNIAIILMMVGIYGLIFEFLAPGTMLPGTIGGICLLLGLYALALLPVSFAALGLIFLGVGLTVAEAHSPSFGALGIGGGVAVILGATILFDPDIPGLEVSRPLLGAIAFAILAFSLERCSSGIHLALAPGCHRCRGDDRHIR